MYTLGQTLIFTSLTQASAAADLWGKEHIKPAHRINGEFVLNETCHWEFPAYWLLVLDTEEKGQWFAPQVGDLVATDDNIRRYVQGYPDIIQVKKTDKIRYWDETGLPFIHTDGGSALYVKRIILRNDKPFPTPQEVIEPEETL